MLEWRGSYGVGDKLADDTSEYIWRGDVWKMELVNNEESECLASAVSTSGWVHREQMALRSVNPWRDSRGWCEGALLVEVTFDDTTDLSFLVTKVDKSVTTDTKTRLCQTKTALIVLSWVRNLETIMFILAVFENTGWKHVTGWYKKFRFYFPNI